MEKNKHTDLLAGDASIHAQVTCVPRVVLKNGMPFGKGRMRELFKLYLWMPWIPLRFNAKKNQRNYCRLMKKRKWLAGRVDCMIGNITATKACHRTTHRSAPWMFAILVVVACILMPQPSLAILLQAAGLLRCCVPSHAVWPDFHPGEGCNCICTGFWSQERHRRPAAPVFHFSQGLLFLPSKTPEQSCCTFYKDLWILES